MTIKKFFESKEVVAVHCKTEEQAKALLKAFDKAGYKWCDGDKYIGKTYWQVYEEATCYSNTGTYADIEWYENEGYKTLEFEEIEIIETTKPALSIVDKEILKILKEKPFILSNLFTSNVLKKQDEYNKRYIWGTITDDEVEKVVAWLNEEDEDKSE